MRQEILAGAVILAFALGTATNMHAATLSLKASADHDAGMMSPGGLHVQAVGYLDVSPNWQAPADKPALSVKAAKTLANYCDKVKWATGVGGKAGAMIVAGNHSTAEDAKIHITIRVYDDKGTHKYSCHAYVNNSCNCNHID